MAFFSRLRLTVRAAAAALALCAVGAGATPAAAFANLTASTLGATAPGEALIYEDGSRGALTDYAGKVLVVTLWQEHCPYCHREMPGLDRLARDMSAEGVAVLPLNLDDSLATARRGLDAMGLAHLPVIVDEGKMNGSILTIEHMRSFSIATPTTYIINPQGIVVAQIWGIADWDSQEARAYLRGLLNS